MSDSDDRYNLVFKGELVKSVALSDAKQNLSRLFKVTGEKLDMLFSGESIILKKNLDFDTANKYRVAIKKAGARVDLVPNEAPSATAIEPQRTNFEAAPPAQKAEFGERLSAASGVTSKKAENVSHETGSVEAAVADQVTYKFDEDIILSPIGTDIATQEEKEPLPLIDVSDMSLGEIGEDLLKPDEREVLPLIEVNTAHLDIEDLGADLLKDNEKEARKKLELDLSAYSVAEIGTNIGDSNPPPPPPPNISGLSLAED